MSLGGPFLFTLHSGVCLFWEPTFLAFKLESRPLMCKTNILPLSYRPSLFKLFIWGQGLTELANLCRLSQKGLEIAIFLPQLPEEIGLEACVEEPACMSFYISLEMNSFAERALFASTVFSPLRESFPTAGSQYF